MSFRSFFFEFGRYFFGRRDWRPPQRIPPASAPCPIGWQPSVLAPVFYGVREYAQPSPCVVFFPSLDGSVASAPILEGCGRYPLILLAHGHCGEAQHYKKWYELPAQLARCGNVVVVPELPATSGGTYPWDPNQDLQVMANLMSWLRNLWPHRNMLMPGRTGIIGHSYGALLGARFASQTAVSAFASLSGTWVEWPTTSPNPLHVLDVPTVHAWGTGVGDVFSSLSATLWNALPRPKHKVVFDGAEHWDYLPAGRSSCEGIRGTCSVVHPFSTDLACTFFGKYMPPEDWPALSTLIPDNLIPPAMSLTVEQQFFAGGHLMGLSLLIGRAGCGVTFAWENRGGQAGSERRP